MRSVSGLRGIVGEDLVPAVVTRYARAFGAFVAGQGGRAVALARDSRQSGPTFVAAAAEGLAAAGVDVVELGMVPTPTAQLAVETLEGGLGGGIVVTASHNPVEWNALKFVGRGGRFLAKADAEAFFALVDGGGAPPAARPGARRRDEGAVRRHLDRVLGLPWLDLAAIRGRKFRVALDCVRGAGATIMPALLEALGCTVEAINLEPDGRFPREPEPIPEHLGELSAFVTTTKADLGIAVDPDVDRLALVDETGRPIGEDYTLAFAVRAVLGVARRRGPVVTNLSTSLVVDDAAREAGGTVERAPVGEANVVERMDERGAVIGGEGNGGVILPEVHLGRDAPVAAALALALLAARGTTVAALVNSAPRYTIVKAKVPRPSGSLERSYAALSGAVPGASADRQDGLRLALPDRWVHVRPSGTEPVVRIIAEAPTRRDAEALVERGRTALAESGR
ncbi:MAG TPA: phosphoglucosamine mutase [Gemmatimonadales bacterium]|nr:phosphoglucosamine mutase [Gemmatimonadales bacterium]